MWQEEFGRIKSRHNRPSTTTVFTDLFRPERIAPVRAFRPTPNIPQAPYQFSGGVLVVLKKENNMSQSKLSLMPAVTAPKGRERHCTQCSTAYRAPRSTSRYCSTACRSKAYRGTAPAGALSISCMCPIGKMLLKMDFAGAIGPASSRDPGPTVYGLTVPNANACAEVRGIFDQKGWGNLSEAEFDQALLTNGIQSYNTYSPEAVQRDRSQARQRASRQRALA